MENLIVKNHAEVLLENIGIDFGKNLKLDGSDDEKIERLIREVEPNELHTALHLEYIFSADKTDANFQINKKIAVIAHINYPDLIDKCFNEYIYNIPPNIDVFITTKGEGNINAVSAKIKGMNNIKIIVPKDRGREISALLVACRDIVLNYDYLCFVHDKKSHKGSQRLMGQSFMDLLWENTIKSGEYIKNVIAAFEREPRLGLLSPPPIAFVFPYFCVGLNAWGTNLHTLRQLMDKMKLKAIIKRTSHPFVLGTSFWCRPKALKPLFNSGFTYEDFPSEPMPADGTLSHSIERIFPFVVQSQGYYSGLMMTEEYASLYLENYRYMLYKTVNHCLKEGKYKTFMDTPKEEEKWRVFYNKFDSIYIMGFSLYSAACMNFLLEQPINKFRGFIKIPNLPNWEIKYPMFDISEIDFNQNIGLIVASGNVNWAELKCNLNKKWCEKIFFCSYV